MPLKHQTETFLLFLLGVVTVATGLVIRTLPDLLNGLIPWGIVFALMVLYPALLGPTFRTNRADAVFRKLHWVPAIMLVVWLALQGLTMVWPAAASASDIYRWGWALVPVTLAFLVMSKFVLKVIRRWVKRLVLLAVAFVPFVVGAVLSETQQWNPEITAHVWQGAWWQITPIEPGVTVAVNSSSSATSTTTSVVRTGKNLDHSQDRGEEVYRERLRAMERRRERIAQQLGSANQESSTIAVASSSAEEAVAGTGKSFFGRMMANVFNRSELSEDAESSVVATTTSSSSSASSVRATEVIAAASVSSTPSVRYGQTSSQPAHLPASGFGWSAILLCGLGLYAANVHRKTIERTLVS